MSTDISIVKLNPAGTLGQSCDDLWISVSFKDKMFLPSETYRVSDGIPIPRRYVNNYLSCTWLVLYFFLA